MPSSVIMAPANLNLLHITYQYPTASCDTELNRILGTCENTVLKVGEKILRKKESGGEKYMKSQPRLLTNCTLLSWPLAGLALCNTFSSCLTSTAAATLACSSADPKLSQRYFKECAAYIHPLTPGAFTSITTEKASRLWREKKSRCSVSGYNHIGQASGNFSQKVPDNNYFRFCAPYDLSCNYSTLPLQAPK